MAFDVITYDAVSNNSDKLTELDGKVDNIDSSIDEHNNTIIDALKAMDEHNKGIKTSVDALPATLDSKFAVTNGKVDAVASSLATHDAAVKALLGDVGAVLDKINGEVV